MDIAGRVSSDWSFPREINEKENEKAMRVLLTGSGGGVSLVRDLCEIGDRL